MFEYRRELDGLRAISVIAVIIYHSQLGFKGGFFGVDVFFVLSGYLITGIVKENIENDSFSLFDFYWRRVKRIFPALLLMLTVTTVISYLLLLPNDLLSYSESLRTSLYFGSNYYFYNEDSYIADDSILKPLLHTWSLSVEWQFYVLFPLVVYLVANVNKSLIFWLLLASTLVSFTYAQVIVGTNPDKAFYLLPTRAWEMTIGGLITYFNREKLYSSPHGAFIKRNIIFFSNLGLIVVVASMLLMNDSYEHPSFYTLIPVLGACAFITFSNGKELFGFITHRVVIYIGLISYPLYLWHQPVFAIFRLVVDEKINILSFVVIFVLVFFLSSFTYKYVEVNFRKNTSKGFKLLIFVVWILFIYISSIGISKNLGYPERFGTVAYLFSDLIDIDNHVLGQKKCHNQTLDNACSFNVNKDNLLLLGDSHAGTLGKHIFNLSSELGQGYLQLTSGGCTGLETVISREIVRGVVSTREKCKEESALIARYLESPDSPRYNIIFVARLPLYLSGKRFSNRQGGRERGGDFWLESAIKEESVTDAIIDKLELWQSLGHKLTLVYPIPEVGWHLSQLISKELMKTILPSQKEAIFKELDIKTLYKVYVSRTKGSFELLDRIKGNNVVRVYPHRIFCNTRSCMTHDKEKLFYYDDDHLSTHGAKLLVDQIAAEIDRNKN